MGQTTESGYLLEVAEETLPDIITAYRQFADKKPVVRTENVVGRSDSAAKALVGAGGVSPTDAVALIAFNQGG